MANKPSNYFAILSAVDPTGPRFHFIGVQVQEPPGTPRSVVFTNVLKKLADETGVSPGRLTPLYFSVEPGELG